MAQQKEYYAFISYKREDEKWAKWLQEKLEHYKFPTTLNGCTDLPKNIRPIFRDVTDLNPGLLAEEINNALRNSEWLIVVCSPRSAKSPWVCKEAQAFIDLGRADHIIPFVIEGKPFSEDVATECYPDALRNLTDGKELLAANINEMGRDAASIKVVARMFGLRFDTLWQRHEREVKRKQNIIISSSVLFVLGVLAVSVFIWRQNISIRRQRDMIENQATVLMQQIDSIQKKDERIKAQHDSLRLSNKLLQEEKDNVQRTLHEVYKRESQIAAARAQQLCDNDDYIAARRQVLQSFPMKLNDPERPFTIEAEAALRRSCEYESCILGCATAAHFLYDSKRERIYGAYGDGICVLDGKTGELLEDWLYEYSQDPRTIRLSMDKAAKRILFPLWQGYAIASAETGEILDTLNCTSHGVYGVFDDNKNRVVLSTGNEGEIMVRDLTTKRIISRSVYLHEGHTNSLEFVDFCLSQNLYLRNSRDNDVFVADITTSEVKTVLHHNNIVSDACFSPSGALIASVTDSTVTVWSVSDGVKLVEGNFGSQRFNNACFSPDETMLAVTDDFKHCTIIAINKNSYSCEMQRLRIVNCKDYWGYSCKPTWYQDYVLAFNKKIDFHGDNSRIKYSDIHTLNTINVETVVTDSLKKNFPARILKYLEQVHYDILHNDAGNNSTEEVIEEDDWDLVSICSDDNHNYTLCQDSWDLGVLWRRGIPIRKHDIDSSAPGVAGPIFLSKKGIIYGYDGTVFDTKSGKIIAECGWTLPALFHNERYLVTTDFDAELDGLHRYYLIVTDVKTGSAIQRIPTPFSFDNSIEKIESDDIGDNIIITGDDGTIISYPIRPLNRLITEQRRTLPDINEARKMITIDYSKSLKESEEQEEYSDEEEDR